MGRYLVGANPVKSVSSLSEGVSVLSRRTSPHSSALASVTFLFPTIVVGCLCRLFISRYFGNAVIRRNNRGLTSGQVLLRVYGFSGVSEENGGV